MAPRDTQILGARVCSESERCGGRCSRVTYSRRREHHQADCCLKEAARHHCHTPASTPLSPSAPRATLPTRLRQVLAARPLPPCSARPVLSGHGCSSLRHGTRCVGPLTRWSGTRRASTHLFALSAIQPREIESWSA